MGMLESTQAGMTAILCTEAMRRFEVIRHDEKLDTHAHLPFLREHAHGNVLEIGVHCGISTTALLAGLEEHGGHLWSVDVHPSCRYVWYGHPQWTFCLVWGVNEWPSDVTFDLAFIDGDHSYDAVMKDLKDAHRQMNPGGLILCHDADCPNSFPGVRKAIDDYCEDRGLRHELRPGSHGLEVIYV
jgi:predicted O-methyltransferase YrrM